MQEIFYYLKNETLDEISDIEIITILDKFYNGYSGRIDNVQEEAERFAKEFKFIGGE